MSEIKRGYPNPNYTEEDILTGKVTEENFLETEPNIVIVELNHYEELVSKAAALDILTASMTRTGKVDDDVVWAVTGAKVDSEIEKLRKEKDDAWNIYWKEHNRAEDLRKKLCEAEEKLKVMCDGKSDQARPDEEEQADE